MDTDSVDNVPDADPPTLTETPDQDNAHQDGDGAPFIERFPLGLAGVPISNMGQSALGFQAPQDQLGTENIWTPFQSQRNWDFA